MARLGQAMTALFVGLAAPATAVAQESPPARESHVTVYGDDPCPPSTDDEVVVCARRPDDERYRIPAPLRRSERRTEASWSSHAAELDELQRDTRPDSCSVVGSYGQSGCTQQMIRQWRAERRDRARQAR